MNFLIVINVIKQQIAQKTESSTEEKQWWTEGKADGSNETAINKQINERNREREGRKIDTLQLQKAMNVAEHWPWF